MKKISIILAIALLAPIAIVKAETTEGATVTGAVQKPLIMRAEDRVNKVEERVEQRKENIDAKVKKIEEKTEAKKAKIDERASSTKERIENKAEKIAQIRAEVDFEINVEAEREVTKILKMLDQIQRHLKIQTKEDLC